MSPININRDLFFQALQIAVVAPYIYKASNEIESDYFRIGLKLVAGSLIFINAKPLIQAAMPTLQKAMDIYLQQQGYKKEAAKVGATVDGEFRPVN